MYRVRKWGEEMEEISLRTTFVALITVVSYLVDAAGTLFWIFLILACLDFLTGLCKAYTQKNIDSHIGRKGILKKFAVICILVVAILLDLTLMEHGLDTGGLVFTVISSWYILMEILSILENVSNMGVKVPLKLYKIVEAMNPGVENRKDNYKPYK